MTTQGSVTAAVTSVSFPVTNQQLTTALPNHPTGAIQTVKIGGGQAQVCFLSLFKFFSIYDIHKSYL